MALNDIARPDHRSKHTLTRRTALAGIAAAPFAGAIPAAAAVGISTELDALLRRYDAAHAAYEAADARAANLDETFEASVEWPSPEPYNPRIPRSFDLHDRAEQLKDRRSTRGQSLKFFVHLTDEEIVSIQPMLDEAYERALRTLPDTIAADAAREAEAVAKAKIDAAEREAIREQIRAEADAFGVTAAEADFDNAREALEDAAEALVAYSPRSIDEVRKIASRVLDSDNRWLRSAIKDVDRGIDDWCRALAGLPPEADDAEPEGTANV